MQKQIFARGLSNRRVIDLDEIEFICKNTVTGKVKTSPLKTTKTNQPQTQQQPPQHSNDKCER